ncbi:lipoprotein NlpD [Gammaproteobacteria bacterium]
MNRIPSKENLGKEGRKQQFFPILLGLCVLSACTSEPPTLSPSSSEEDAGFVYVVKPGDSLSIIALQHGENYRNLARWNGIPPPYTIYPGQRLQLTPPPNTENVPEIPISESQPFTKENFPKELKPNKKETSANKKNKDKLDAAERLHWGWPAKGKTLRGFSSSNQGIDISGRKGDPIIAAADGKVVYSGTGIIGYGPLIIIKHDDHYLSAYAHNKYLLVKEGDYVVQGQKIAEMGTNQSNQILLHFEIRRNGKSVNPIPYLTHHN